MMAFMAPAALVGAIALAPEPIAQERYERKGRGEWTYEYKDGLREVKRERKRNGEWKEEFKDANCEVKREQKSSGEYKEEIKCQ
ncbi:MAG TPA: hypothetical protein VHG30_05990 [Microvirga sp.]|nr:hypothetical protein [Microvirga sp.]